MTELDKKIQKSQADLVPQVLDAFEKKNMDRCDILITNAFKQLKMSRFKPDQTACIALTYLARVCPNVFSQSSTLKEQLKSHIKRDNGPASIKSTKNDYVIPVLAANILLACCDSPAIRTIILTRIEHWISTSQRLNEPIVQHLLATLCLKSNGDAQTVKTLVDIRNHWFQFLENNFDTYGLVSKDLSVAIRGLTRTETNCESVVENLAFLKRHDTDITGLTTEISRLITKRPITFETWLDHPDCSDPLKQIVMSLYNRLFEQLSSASEGQTPEVPVFIEIPSSPELVAIEEVTLEAIFSLIASDKLANHHEHADLVTCWLHQLQTKPIIAYKDATRASPYEIATNLVLKLIHTNDLMVDLALKCASPQQLIELVHQFGLRQTTLEKIFKKLKEIEAEVLVKLGFNSSPYFNELMQLYSEMGIDSADKLAAMEHAVEDIKDLKPVPMDVKIKAEPV